MKTVEMCPSHENDGDPWFRAPKFALSESTVNILLFPLGKSPPSGVTLLRWGCPCAFVYTKFSQIKV